MLNRPASFFLRAEIIAAHRGDKKESPCPHKGKRSQLIAFFLVRAAAQYVCSQKALGPLHEFILHGLSLIQGPVAILLDSGKVDEHVFPGRALNEAIAFGSVKPLYSSLLFHKCNSFRLQRQIGKLRLLLRRWRKRLLLCRPDGSFPQSMAAVPEGPKATPATGSFGEFKLLYKNINQNAPCGLSCREQSIIFRNSGSCKALCLQRGVTPKGTCFMELSFLPKWYL